MNKKFLSLVLSLVMVLGTFTSVFAADSKVEAKKEEVKKTSPSAKIQWMIDQKLVEGRKIFKPGEEKNDLALDKNITRAEITKMLVYAKGQENLADMVKATSVPYSDVKADHWANGFITVGTFKMTGPKGVAMLAGYPDGTFKPEKNVSYEELAKMLVVLVKGDLTPQMAANAKWPGSWLTWAADEGILEGINFSSSKDAATRNFAFQMIYNAMYIHDTRHDVDYGTRIGVVSGYEDGKLIINQGDKQFKVTLDAKTTYVNESGRVGYLSLNNLSGESRLFVGSLVEVITNKTEKAEVVSHIMELGNPSKGVIANRWYGVAEKTIQGLAKVNDDTIDMYSAVMQSYNSVNKKGTAVPAQGKVVLETNKNTRYFVADEMTGWLTEVSEDQAKKLVKVDDGKAIQNVYAGYDVYGREGRQANRAKVVVFNVTTDDKLNAKVVRVINPSDGLFTVNVQNTKAEESRYDLSGFNAFFPGTSRDRYNGHFDKYDVLKVRVSEDNKVGKLVDVRIKHADAPTFKVENVKYGYDKEIDSFTLVGNNGKLPDVTFGNKAYEFIEGKLVNGDYIQLDKDDYVTVKENGVTSYKLSGNMVITNGISIVPAGKLANLAGASVQNERKVIAHLVAVAENGNNSTVTVDRVRYNAADRDSIFEGEKTYAISKAEAQALSALLGNNKDYNYIELTIYDTAYTNVKEFRNARVDGAVALKEDAKAKEIFDKKTALDGALTTLAGAKNKANIEAAMNAFNDLLSKGVKESENVKGSTVGEIRAKLEEAKTNYNNDSANAAAQISINLAAAND